MIFCITEEGRNCKKKKTKTYKQIDIKYSEKGGNKANVEEFFINLLEFLDTFM